MSAAQKLHREAMSAANEAYQARETGDRERFQKLIKKAFEKEKEAAELLFSKPEAEPTRSILYRSAAQFAVDCGKFKEAEKLIATALLGNPPAETLAALRLMNQQVCSYFEMLPDLDGKIDADEYLQMLRNKALNVSIKPKNPTYRSAVLMDNIVEVLRKIRESFLNYIEIDFQRKFSQSGFKDMAKLIADVKNDARPLIVNLKFQGFSASISSDLFVMAKQYAPEISEWRIHVFEQFKQDVFEQDYGSINGVQPIVGQFNAEERRRIYTPVIDLLRDSNPYSFAVTDAGFLKTLRKFHPVSKPVRDLLLPPDKNEDAPKSMELYQIFGMAEPDSSSIPKSNIIARQTMTSAEFKQRFMEIHAEKDVLILKEPLEVMIQYDKPVFAIRSELLDINANAYDYAGVLKEFQHRFMEVYRDLTTRATDDLTLKEVDAKSFIEFLVLAPQM